MDTEFQTGLLLKKHDARSVSVYVCVWMRDMMLGHGLLLLAAALPFGLNGSTSDVTPLKNSMKLLPAQKPC